MKSEPDEFGLADLQSAPAQTAGWDGVRNYQARNMLRDDVAVGDRVLFHHSNAKPMIAAATMEVLRAGYPDLTAFDPKEQHYDPKSDPDEPTWYMVDVQLLQQFPPPVTRDDLKRESALGQMMVLQRGSRLSIQPVTAAEWKTVHKLAGVKDV